MFLIFPYNKSNLSHYISLLVIVDIISTFYDPVAANIIIGIRKKASA